MRSGKIFSVIACGIMVLAFASMAWADSYHYKNIIVGDRASGMGGAYTAISDDPSGSYYNPAGLVYTQGTNVSASANAYHNTEKTYSNVLGGLGWERKASSLLPNFFGVVQKLGKGRLGLAYVVPDTVVEDQDQVFRYIPSDITGPDMQTEHYLNFNNEDNTHLFGLSYAREINDSMSWGMSVFYHHRRIQWILNESVTYDNGESRWYNMYYESEEDGVMPILGFMWTPADKYSFGASISKTFISGSRTSAQRTEKGYFLSKAETESSKTGKNRKYPLNINVGAAYFASETFLISADVSYYTSEKDKEPLLDIERTWVTNFSLGTEYYFSPNLAMRAGAYTNMSAAPDIKRGVTSVAEDKVDMTGLTFSLSHFGRGSSLTTGLGYAWGDGDAQVTGNNTEMQKAEIKSWTVYLSNSYGF